HGQDGGGHHDAGGGSEQQRSGRRQSGTPPNLRLLDPAPNGRPEPGPEFLGWTALFQRAEQLQRILGGVHLSESSFFLPRAYSGKSRLSDSSRILLASRTWLRTVDCRMLRISETSSVLSPSISLKTK